MTDQNLKQPACPPTLSAFPAYHQIPSSTHPIRSFFSCSSYTDLPSGYGNISYTYALCISLLVSGVCMASDEALGCDYQGRHFGAAYPDAQCVDGFLWDEDSCDEPGGALLHGGDTPCPKCNSAVHATYYGTEEDSASPSAQSAGNGPYQLLPNNPEDSPGCAPALS